MTRMGKKSGKTVESNSNNINVNSSMVYKVDSREVISAVQLLSIKQPSELKEKNVN